MQFLITEIVGVYLLVNVVSSCPSGCNCYNNTEGLVVSCDSIPTDIPNNTYTLQVYTPPPSEQYIHICGKDSYFILSLLKKYTFKIINKTKTA
jgi:hypothetical protein